MSEKQKAISRKSFLKRAGIFTAGAVAAGGALGLVKPKKSEAAFQALPWPYATLDVELVRQRGYENYFVAGCMYATTSSLLTTLIETVGAPWDSLPMAMFNYGAGGAYGWGTTCGTLNGTSYIIQLAAGADANMIINDLMQWYCNEPFPSTNMDAYATYTNQRQTIAESPLCHISVSQWTNASRKTIHSYERKDRCAKVAGDTAAKAAEFLNAWKAGTFTPTFAPTAEYQRCVDCHVGSTSTYDNAVNKSDCNKCHDDKADHYL